MQILLLSVVLTKIDHNDELEQATQEQKWLTMQEFDDLILHQIEDYDKIEIVGNSWYTIGCEEDTEKLQERISELELELDDANERVEELESKLDDAKSWLDNVQYHIYDAQRNLENISSYLDDANEDVENAISECEY